MYIPPKKWEWDKENGGKFSKINRPTSGSTFNKDLPVGKHKLQLYLPHYFKTQRKTKLKM